MRVNRTTGKKKPPTNFPTGPTAVFLPPPPAQRSSLEGITPELFWANSERLVGLANGGDRSAFEAATAALIARTKKTATAAAAAAADGVSTDGGNGAASRREGGAPKEGNSSIGGGGAKSGEDGGHRGVEERWQPGGPDVHAVLGATGEEEREGEDRGDRDKTGQGRAGQDRKGQDRTG